MAYRFNGTTDKAEFAIAPLSGHTFGPLTWAALVKRNTVGGAADQNMIAVTDSGNNSQLRWRFTTADRQDLAGPGNNFSAESYASTSLYYIVAITTSDLATVSPRFHNHNETSWTHATNGVAGLGGSVPLTGANRLKVGSRSITDFFNGDIVCMGIKKGDSTDAAIQTLSRTSFQAWRDFGFDWLIGFDPSLVSGGVLQDQASPGTGDQVAITGTTVVSDPPGWAWTAPVAYNDSASGTVTASGSGTESHGFILGYDTHGSNVNSMGTGRQCVSKFTLASAGTLNELHGWLRVGTGASTIRLIIYKSDANVSGVVVGATGSKPGTRVAYSNPIPLTGSGDVHLSEVGFSVPLPAGDYWIGARSDVAGGLYLGTNNLGSGSNEKDNLSDPPPNPFGQTGASSIVQLSCWAVVGDPPVAYTDNGSGTITASGTGVENQVKTLGRTAASSGFEDSITGSDRVRVYRATLTTAGRLEELWTSVRISGGSCTFRIVVYDDDGAGGEPGTLLAVGADLTPPTASSFAGEAVRGGAVVTPVDLPSGDYWLGLHEVVSGGAVLVYDDDGTSVARTSTADAFAGGASNPWAGTSASHPTSSQRTWAVLSPITATYTDSRTATVTASGSGVESFQPPPVAYTDSRSGTIIASGSGVESYFGIVVIQGQGQIAIAVGLAALTGVVSEPDPTTVTMTGSATIGLFADGALEYPDLPPRVSASFYDRWRSGLHIGNARPGQRVQVRRGRFHRRHGTWYGPPMNGVSIPGFSMARPWQPFWTPKTNYIDVPNVREVRLDQSLDQNGITTATLTIDNIYYRPESGGQHSIKRGFLAPLRGYVGPGRTRLVDEQGEPVNQDPTWFSLLAQDAQITVHQSYGDQEIKTFTGLIDEVDIVSSPDVITITARDFGKVLTESHLYGWNKEWPAEGDEGFLLDPITFAAPDDADDTHAAGENATASSGSGADNVIDGDGDTSWTSDRHTTPSVTEYVQVRLPQGRYNDFTVNVESDDMEMYVSLLPKNLKGDVSPTRNDVAIADNQWVDGGSGSTVPGDNGGIRYLRHITGIAKGSHRYHLTSDEDDFRIGDDSILRLSFRNLDRVAGTGSARYAASVVAVRAWRRTLSAEARRRHWVLVDDASDVVRTMLRWAGFKEWEVEDTGAPLSEKYVVNRGMTYMDVIKRMADVSGYTFFMADPTTKSNSLGMPTYRRTQTVTDAAPVVTVHDTDLLGPIDVRESDEPLAYIIRMRGRVAPNRGRTVGGDTTKRLMYVYQPPWTVRPGGNQLGGILRHVIHTDDLFKTMDDCKFAAFYLALNEALAALTATIQIPSNPGVQLDDHVEVFDLGTGVTSRLSVQQRSSQLTRSGEQTLWSMTLGGALVDTLDIQAVVRRINSAKRA